MAPERPRNDDAAAINALKAADDLTKAVVQDLFQLIVQAYDHQGTATEQVMHLQVKQLVHNLLALQRAAPSIKTTVPPELIQYVQNARNPDIYTREVVEMLMRSNQTLKGKVAAFGDLRDVLAKEMIKNVDGVEEDVRRIVEGTGGSLD